MRQYMPRPHAMKDDDIIYDIFDARASCHAAPAAGSDAYYTDVDTLMRAFHFARLARRCHDVS